jgi:DNA-directed RNA polymerase specialized sigma24 family protein
METQDRSNRQPESIEDEMKEFCEALYRLIMSETRRWSRILDEGEQEEVIHNIFEAMVWHRHKLHGWSPQGCRGYVRRAVGHAIIDLKKSGGRLVSLDDSQDGSIPAIERLTDDSSNPERLYAETQDAALWRGRVEALRSLVEEQLTRPQRDVLRWWLCSSSFADIAEKTGRSEVACRKSLSRDILPKLRKAMKSQGLM